MKKWRRFKLEEKWLLFTVLLEIFKRILSDEEMKAADEKASNKCAKCDSKFNSLTNRKIQW